MEKLHTKFAHKWFNIFLKECTERGDSIFRPEPFNNSINDLENGRVQLVIIYMNGITLAGLANSLEDKALARCIRMIIYIKYIIMNLDRQIKYLGTVLGRLCWKHRVCNGCKSI